ncbi:hypothetical protein Tco_0144932 [Tanacetum coccineum]
MEVYRSTCSRVKRTPAVRLYEAGKGEEINSLDEIRTCELFVVCPDSLADDFVEMCVDVCLKEDLFIRCCEKFKEFDYLLKIDHDLLTKDINGFKTYEEYKDDWIYEWNENIPWVYEKPWTKIGWPTYSWKEDGYCNRGNLPGAYIVGNTLCYQDLEWYDALKDNELKDEALRNKAIME